MLYLYSYRAGLIAQLKDWKNSTDHYRKELTKLIEEKNYYESDTQKVCWLGGILNNCLSIFVWINQLWQMYILEIFQYTPK